MAPPDGPQSLSPGLGWGVLHLFCRCSHQVDRAGVHLAEETARKASLKVVTVAVLGHKADVGFVAMGPDLWDLRQFQQGVTRAGLEPVWSYISLTEVSEYATGVPEEMKLARLYPDLPPEGKRAFCFYPMSKRRSAEDNWYRLPFDGREALMRGHGAVGRTFRGRVVQLVTGSTGLDDWEWGVTLFATGPDDLKECVYQMRFDEASARYAEFGPFYAGIVSDLDEVLERTEGS